MLKRKKENFIVSKVIEKSKAEQLRDLTRDSPQGAGDRGRPCRGMAGASGAGQMRGAAMTGVGWDSGLLSEAAAQER